MEDIAFNDWPGQPVDLSGMSSTTGSAAAGAGTTNSWYPAYGFQPPPGLLEREDFLGNPDADYFFQGNPPPYLYLETIHEETSDDLRSDSDLSEAGGEARAGVIIRGGGFRDGLSRSPLGWLASDSETDSVICMDVTNDDTDSESDREIACPVKRRRQDNNNVLLSLPSEDDYQSLSRSSSLLQFETLEKQCQETSSSSPSLYSQYSIDSLEFPQIRLSVANNQQQQDLTTECKKNESESSDSGDSETTLKSCNNLIKAWHSLDSLPCFSKTSSNVVVVEVVGGSTSSSGSCDKSKEKISVENLSEDSGYSDHIKASSRSSDSSMTAAPTPGGQAGGIPSKKKLLCKTDSSPNFGAYDCEVFQQFTGNFGASCQNLSIFDDPTKWISLSSTSSTSITSRPTSKNASLILDKLPQHHQQQLASECGRTSCSKFNSLSEPNLLIQEDDDDFSIQHNNNGSLISDENGIASTSSVPKDLDLLVVHNKQHQNFRDESCWSGVVETSIAAKNWDLGDLNRHSSFVLHSASTSTMSSSENNNNKSNSSSYRREGSYAEAMRNRVDLSDDEQSLCHVKKKPSAPAPKTTLEIFDRKILNVITESIQSINSNALPDAFVNNTGTATKSTLYGQQTNKRNVVSTPNLATNQSDVDSEIIEILMEDDRRRSVQDIPRRQSTSTSCISDADDVMEERTLLKSIYGESSQSSKGVHFSPVVSEVNWRDTNEDSRSSSPTATPERESSYSLSNSSSPERDVQALTKILLGKSPSSDDEPEFTSSQPQLSRAAAARDYHDGDDDERDRIKFKSQSQPDISKMRRRGSQVIKRDKDGCIIKAYIDKDGIEYRHTNIAIGVVKSGPVRPTEVGPAHGISAAATVAVAAVVNRGPPLLPTTADTTANNNKSHMASGPGGVLAASDGSGRKDINININKHRGTAREYASRGIMDLVNVNSGAARPASAAGGGGALLSDRATSDQRIVNDNNKSSKSGARGNKLGGFFSRLASFRFSNRKSATIGGADGGGGRAKKKADGAKKDFAALQQPQQRVATKDDYIYIPLKGPSTRDTNNSNNNNNNRENNSTSSAVSNNQLIAHKNGLTNHQNRFFHQDETTPHQQVLRNKPPLPTNNNNNNLITSGRSSAGSAASSASAPPRVVGACVKRDGGGGVATPRGDDSDDIQQHHHQQEHQRRPHQQSNNTTTASSTSSTSASGHHHHSHNRPSSGSGSSRRRTTPIDSGVHHLQDTTPSPPPAPWCRQQQGGGRSSSNQQQQEQQGQHQSMDQPDSSSTTAYEEDVHERTPPHHRMGLIETDLDTEVTVITSRSTCSPYTITNSGSSSRPPSGPGSVIQHQLLHHRQGNNVVKTTRSLLNLGEGGCERGASSASSSTRCTPPGDGIRGVRRGADTLGAGGINDSSNSAGGRPHKSMEFLLDKQNLKVVEPPENELQKGERVMSEHQLRVQRSLQKLNVPDWYKQNHVPREGFLLLRKPSSSFSTNRETRWAGTCSTAATNKTTSLSSLGSNTTNASSYAQQSSSPVTLSPTAAHHHQQQQPFVRWSTSKLNSTASSPCASTRSSFNARQPNGSISPSSVRSSFSYRQPYLGWRSQEKLARPRTPAERLANSLLGNASQNSHHHQQQPQPQVEESPDFQSSIKEMTSAIVHYVHGLKPDDENHQNSSRSKSSSPRGSSQRLCWLESSFVGVKPLDSPQTPVVGLAESQSSNPTSTSAVAHAPHPNSLRLELQTHNGESVHA